MTYRPPIVLTRSQRALLDPTDEPSLWLLIFYVVGFSALGVLFGLAVAVLMERGV